MNTKGIKFLAVLAVLAMAFAVFATIAPAESDDAATTNVESLEQLTEAIGQGQTDITITTGFTIDSEVTIPAGTTVTIAGSQTVTVSSVLTNNGTIVNNGTLTVAEDGAKITASSASAKGEIKGTGESVLIGISQGTIEKQKFSVDADHGTAVILESGSTGTATLKNLEFVTVSEGHGISVNGTNTVAIESIAYTATSSIVSSNLISINGAATKVTIKDISLNNVMPDKKHGILDISNNVTVGPISTAEDAAKVQIDKTVTSMVWNNDSAAIVDDITMDNIYIRGAFTLTVPAGKTLTADIYTETQNAKVELAQSGVSNGAGGIFDGSFAYGVVSGNNVTVHSAEMKLMSGTAVLDIVAGSVKITGMIGKLEGSFIAQTEGTVALGNGSANALQVPTNTTLDLTGVITGDINNKGTVNLDTGVNVKELAIVNEGTGKVVDNTDDDDMEELVIGGNSQGQSTVFSEKQKVIVSSELGYWTLNSGSTVTILGALVIPEGTVLTVQADARLIIDNEAKVYVYGQLVIDAKDIEHTYPGKLTVSMGIVTVEGSVSLNGTLFMGYKSPYVTEIDVAYGGSFIIGENGSFDATTAAESKFCVKEGGDLTVYGTMGVKIYNSGQITINSEARATSATTIYMITAGAVVDVRNYTVLASAAGTATLTISDEGLVFTKYRHDQKDVKVTLAGAKDLITIGMTINDNTSNYSVTFSGLQVIAGYKTAATVEETSDTNAAKGIYNGKQYSKYLDVSGTFYVDYTYIGSSTGEDKDVTATVNTNTETGTLKKFCSVKVTDEIVINDYVTLNNATGVLTVTGSIDTMSKDAKVTNAATITVADAGNISCVINTINSESGINAAKFMTMEEDAAGKTYKVYNYYSIDGALAAINEGVQTTEVIILGSQTMKISAVLPDGITLVLINSDAKLTINKDVAFTVDDTAVVKGEGKIYVNGSMYAEEKTAIKNSTTVISDVKTEELDAQGKPTKTGWAMWTNLTDALAAAQAGDVITITKKTGNEVSVSKNLTIPDGVTLVAPKDYDPLYLNNGVTLTIDGILIVGSNIYAQQAFGLDAQNITSTGTNANRYSSAIVVNGALISTSEIKYGNGYAAINAEGTENYRVALIGGTFIDANKYTTDNTNFVNGSDIVGGVKAPIAGAYYTIKDGSTTYRVISSLAFAAENLDVITSDILIHGDVSALILSFEKMDEFKMITVNNDGETTAPTAVGNKVYTELTVATLVLDEVSLVSTANGTFTGIVGNGTDALTCVDAKKMTVLDKDDKLYVHGAVTADTTGAGLAVTAGAVYLGTDGAAFTFNGTDKNYLTVADGAEAIVENCGSTAADVIDYLWVEGYFGVPAGKSAFVTDLVDLGEVEVAAVTESTAKGNLTITNLFVGTDAAPKDAKEMAPASIGGPITLTGKAYVMADAELGVDTELYLSTLHYTTFYIEDEEFYTVVAVGAEVQLDSYIPLILEAKISYWMDEDGNPITFAKETPLTPYVGTYDAVYAYVDYNIYAVQIVTDAGVKSVAINGIEMVNQGNNVFTIGLDKDGLKRLVTGTYKVTYTLKSGYQEDKNGVTLYTEDGTVLKNLTFVASGAYGDKTIILQLNGTEIIPEPEPVTPEEQSEWTITTILLVVLVILIAIMAVIVALRLNRN